MPATVFDAHGPGGEAGPDEHLQRRPNQKDGHQHDHRFARVLIHRASGDVALKMGENGQFPGVLVDPRLIGPRNHGGNSDGGEGAAVEIARQAEGAMLNRLQ